MFFQSIRMENQIYHRVLDNTTAVCMVITFKVFNFDAFAVGRIDLIHTFHKDS